MASHSGITSGRADVTWAVLLVTGLAALLGLRIAALSLNGTDLFFDEAQYWSWSRAPDFGYYSKPPLIAWMIHGTTALCGHGEFCVRLSSPIVHTLTSLTVFLIGRRLYGTVTGVFAALAFATLPGVSLSAGIISTDVPLLFFWAVALFALVMMRDTRSWWPALLLGVALGGGLNAKYAMVWFVLCLAIYLFATPRERRLVKDARLWIALLIAAALIAPNLWWNFAHKFATLSHTADNANWQGKLPNPLKALEFIGAQFGVFGPILFAGLILVTWRAWREGLPEADRLLLAFSVPVILVITAQAFLSRAHANWAAVAYVAASVLVVATMIRDLDWAWLRRSMVINVAALVLITAATVLAGRFALPTGVDPFARTLGWRALGEATRAELEAARRLGKPYAVVLADERSVTAELIYYLRDEPTPVQAWRSAPRPGDHFELTRPYNAQSGEPVLLVSLSGASPAIVEKFKRSVVVNQRTLAAGAGKPRQVTFIALADYTGQGYAEK